MATVSAPTALEQLLNDLESHQLTTILAPSKQGINEWDQIRVNVDVNPKWYQRLCAEHQSKRKIRRGKFDTRIRRANVLWSLKELIEGRDGGIYGPELVKIAGKLKS